MMYDLINFMGPLGPLQNRFEEVGDETRLGYSDCKPLIKYRLVLLHTTEFIECVMEE